MNTSKKDKQKGVEGKVAQDSDGVAHDSDGVAMKPQVSFKQWIALTPKHLTLLEEEKITMEDLLQQKIIEYVSPGEQENLLIAIDHDKLWENKSNPLVVFSHCDVPAAMFGFAALLCPLGHHNPAARVVLSTQQVKQACGWFSLAWPFRIDKESFLQFHCELPVVNTIANKFIQPNGNNVIMAIMCYSG